MICPKCSYERSERDPALVPGVLLLSNGWGGYLLYVEYCGRTDPAFLQSDDQRG